MSHSEEATMNDVLKAIRERRSVRKFTTEQVSEEALGEILEAGRWSPSGLNNQPWRFVVIVDPEMRSTISEKTKYRKVLEQAPLQIAVFLDVEVSYNREKDLQGVGACLQNMQLAAHSLGLGAVWMGEILNRREEVEQALQVPERFELMAVLAVGHPDGTPAQSSRKPLSELIFRQFL
jgi:nitroreductase